MPAGDLISQDYQYEYSSLLMGAGTVYLIEKIEGLYDMPEIASRDIIRSDIHGVFPGTDLMGGRRLVVLLDILASNGSTAESYIRNLNLAFRPSNQELWFVFKRPNMADKRFVLCRCRRKALDTDYKYSYGLVKGSVELFASDPRIYSITEETENVTILDTTTVSPTIVVDNIGDFNTGATIDLAGPITNPVITNPQDESKAIRLTCVIPTGTILRIDTKARTVQTSTGGAAYVDHYEYVRTDNQWWALQAGVNNLQVNRTNTAGASTVEVRWRAAWL